MVEQLALGEEPRAAARLHDEVAVRERVEVRHVVAGDDQRAGRGDPFEALEPPVEPQLERRPEDTLHDPVPGFQRGLPEGRGMRPRAARMLPAGGSRPAGALAWSDAGPRDPVKSLSRAKSRLAPALSPLERGALTLAMLEDMLDVTFEIPGWETWVVSPDEVALEISARRGAKPIPEERGPLSAADPAGGVAREGRSEADALAVLPGDLPMVTAQALHAAVKTLGAVVLAPASDGTGTSLLLRRPPRAIPSRFGPDSFRRHRDLAAARGLPVAVVELPELAFDLDRPGRYPAAADGRPRGSDPRGLPPDGSRGASAQHRLRRLGCRRGP